jgi:hypothetical protein
MSTFIKKLIMTMAGVGVYALAEHPYLAGARDGLVAIAGGLVMSAHLRSPGDVRRPRVRQ